MKPIVEKQLRCPKCGKQQFETPPRAESYDYLVCTGCKTRVGVDEIAKLAGLNARDEAEKRLAKIARDLSRKLR